MRTDFDSTASVSLRQISPFAEDALELIRQLNEHNLSHYPPEDCHLDSPEVLALGNCTMLGAYIGPELCGIGAVKFFENYGEIKRMFVVPSARGKGLSKLILQELIDLIGGRGLQYARLETGFKYKAAVNLCRSFGFEICEKFGDYETNESSVFMQRKMGLARAGDYRP